MPRETVEPTVSDEDSRFGATEEHPAWAMIGATRVTSSPGAVLFDSEIRHQHYVSVKLSRASRQRHLSRDWLHSEQQIIEVHMSEAQWASFVSSMGVGNGVPCTLSYDASAEQPIVPNMPFAPRLQESMDEVKGAADKAVEKVRVAQEAVQEAFDRKAGRVEIRELLSDLQTAVSHMPANATFAARSLTEHAENVVQKARVDIEAMVQAKADQLGLDPGDVAGVAQLTAAPEDESS